MATASTEPCVATITLLFELTCTATGREALTAAEQKSAEVVKGNSCKSFEFGLFPND